MIESVITTVLADTEEGKREMELQGEPGSNTDGQQGDCDGRREEQRT
jgi:hypothetical protein